MRTELRLIPVSAGLLALLLLACGGSAVAEEELADPRDARIEVLETQLSAARLERAALNRERDVLAHKLAVAEQRLGTRPFTPKVVEPAGGPFRVGRTMRIAEHGARAKKGALKQAVSGLDAYVVAFWATWCKPCIAPEELRALDEMESELVRSGSGLVAVAIDGLDEVIGHPRAAEWHYPVWHRKDAHIEWLPEAFIREAGLGLPLFVVVSGEGRLLYAHAGKLTPESQEELVTAALAPRPRAR